MTIYYDEQKQTTTTNPRRDGVYYPCKPSKKSFPPNPSTELLARYGFYPTRDVKPEYDRDTEACTATGWEINEEGTAYVRQYEITALDEDIVAETMRTKRDALLAESDIYVLADYPHEDGELAAWVTYRQALRDVTEQEGFPYEIEWPESP